MKKFKKCKKREKKKSLRILHLYRENFHKVFRISERSKDR